MKPATVRPCPMCARPGVAAMRRECYVCDGAGVVAGPTYADMRQATRARQVAEARAALGGEQ